MKVVVDTNIVFSAMLNSQGKIGQLLVLGSRHFEYFTIGLLRQEIIKHKDKLLKLSGYSEEHMERVFQIITARIKFVDDVLLSEVSIQEAKSLVSKIDVDDALFLALCYEINAKLWTGDKRLIKGLQVQSYEHLVSTDDLYNLFLSKR